NVPLITIGETAKLDGGVYAAGYCKWTFEPGCNVIGSDALMIKSGDFTINGGTFIGNGEYNEPEPYGNGMDSSGAAIQVTSHDSYAGNVVLNINGGTFTSENNSALLYTNPEPAAKVNVLNEVTINPSADFISKNESSAKKPINVRLSVNSFDTLKTAFGNGYNVFINKDFKMGVGDSFTVPSKYANEELNKLNILLRENKTLPKHNITTSNGGVLQGWSTSKNNPIANYGIEDVLSTGTYYPVFQFNISNVTGITGGKVWAVPSKANVSEKVQLKNESESGSHLVKYIVTKEDDSSVSVPYDVNTETFVMPEYNVTVNAEFSNDNTEYNITTVIQPEAGGTIIVTPEYAQSGTIITITATATEGYTFKSFTVMNKSKNPSGEFVDANGKFRMPAYNVTVTAAFTKSEVPVTPTPTSDDNYYYDDDDDDSSSSSTTTTPTVNPTQKPTVTPTPTVKPTPEPKTVVIVETEVKFEDNKVITSITVPEGSSGSITFTQTEEKGMDEWIPESIEDTYSFDLSCDGEINGDSEIHFVMSDVILKSLGLTPEDVCLKHLENGVWVKLKISYIVLDDGTYYFTAITKSFSPFKISFDGKSEDEPTVTPTEEQPTKSPMPIVGLLMGLGAAALVLRRK
ncbi:MAG TPA: PGF-pre-PGF domain-containing protein, partial [Methanocorpusculum sp.]|nr:PGF-pre-PGF domain-containing protein [Methanocorpusculum sp.]